MRIKYMLSALIIGLGFAASASAAVMTSTTSGVITREGNSDFWGSPWGTGSLVGTAFTLTLSFEYSASDIVPSVLGGSGIDDVGSAFGSLTIDGMKFDFSGIGTRYSYYYANAGGTPNFGQGIYNMDIGGGRVLSASNWIEGPIPMTNDLLVPVIVSNPANTKVNADFSMTQGPRYAYLNVGQNLSYDMSIAVDSTAVPEPASWALIGLGLLSLAQFGRRRKS